MANPNFIPNAVAMRCGKKGCPQTFPLAKRGDPGSYNVAGYERHLRDIHAIFLPKPILVIQGWGGEGAAVRSSSAK